MTAFNEPYPNIGIVLQKLASLADTSRLAFTDNNKRYRKDEDYSSRKTSDTAVLNEAVEQLFRKPLCKVVTDDFGSYFAECVRYSLLNYIELIKRVPMEGIQRKKVVEMLNRHLFVETLASLIWHVGREQMQANDIPEFYFEENPIPFIIQFYEEQTKFKGTSFSQYFKENIRSATKWRSGQEIPNIGSLQSLAQWASLSCPNAIDGDKQTLFLSRFIASFHKKTGSKYVEALKHALAFRLQTGIEPAVDIGSLFFTFYEQEINKMDIDDLALFGQQLHQELKRSSNKPAGSLKTFTQKVNLLNEKIIQREMEEELAYHCDWLNGRLALLSGNFDKAATYYVDAVEKSLYKAGNNIRDLLKEALAVNAIQTKPHKPTLKKLKNRALTFYPKIIEPELRKLPVIVSEEDIFNWRFWFIAKFPKCGWFSEGAITLEKKTQEIINSLNG